ncbi:MAG: CARDB domain-containing protein [bacterium]|nr:CARDB domain-containing protein [bacterium]
MSEPIQQGQPLLTKTKTKITTKAIVVASVALLGAGLFAVGGLQLPEPSLLRGQTGVCNGGSNVGRTCRSNRDCKIGATSNMRGYCVPAQPDLEASLSATCNTGDTRGTIPILFTATSINRGTADAGSHVVRVFAARPDGTGVTLFEETIPSLRVGPPGTVITDSISATILTTGVTQLQLVTDWNQTVTESNESNNSTLITLPSCSTTIEVAPPLPDLHNLFERIPDTPTEGSPFTFRVSVQNLGTGAAGPSVSSLQIDRNNDGFFDETLSTRAIPTIAAGATAEAVEWNWPAWRTGGPHRLVMCADSGSTVAESDEGNNCSTAVIVANTPSATRFFLSAASPSGMQSPSSNSEVMRFVVTAENSDTVLSRFRFVINATDNSNNGWNTWRGSTEPRGINNASFQLYDTLDLSTPLSGTWEVIGNHAPPYTDTDTGMVVRAVEFGLRSFLTIPAGTSRMFRVEMNTVGASGIADDTVQIIQERAPGSLPADGFPVTGNIITF